ncbi:MAG: TetR/AcrR family transcriptional regulator [Sandaracinaceae bacterium]|nr:TetR/AcrR family transcriptional regulator [Sandaracinaceae bacterium]
MARPKSFDRGAVVASAMQVFWREGYQGASLSSLGPAMGLQPGSIYATFGSKEALFREALSAYSALVREGVDGDHGPRAILERWFARLIDAALDVPDGELGRGCLLLASAVETPRLDPESAAQVRRELDALEAFLRRCVAAERRRSPRPDAPGPAATARLLVASLAGISALSRAGAPRRTLEDVANAALALV